MSKIRVRQDWDASLYDGISSVALPDKVLSRVQLPEIVISDPHPGIQLEAEQKAALADVIHWLIHPDYNDRVLTLGGYAGTGKSTLISYIDAYLSAIGLDFAITTLTGKGVLVLQSNGMSYAQTMHSLLYYVDEDARRRDKVLKFIKNSRLHEYIIIVDEGQTLSDRALQDFLSFPHVRVILVGDHGQLQPIDGNDHHLMDNPRIKLEEVQRQALGSNVIKMAHFVRQGKMPTYGEAENVRIVPRERFFHEMTDPDFNQIIVGFNKTRHRVNREVRQIRGFYGDFPVPGDKVICLNNCPALGLHNGQIFQVNDVDVITDELIELDLEENRMRYSKIKAMIQQFGSNKLDYELANKFYRLGHGQVNFFDYGYGITYYKAIGSQWRRVALLEECHPDWDLRRLAYTGMTRATESFAYYR